MRLRFVGTLALLAAASVVMSGCPDRQLKPLNPCTVSGVVRQIKVDSVDKVDLLFIVDNSGSMEEEQLLVRDQLEAMVTALASGSVTIGGVAKTFPQVQSLHIGVISSDIGTDTTNPFSGGGCTRTGDGAILLDHGSATDADATCNTTYSPAYQAFAAGGDVMQTAHDVGCRVGAVGIDGCAFEQQLEAALKALTAPLETTGANAGFLQDGSLLALVFVSDEDDCSAADQSIFDLSKVGANGTTTNDYALLCTSVGGYAYKNDPTKIYPVQRYIDGFLGLRSDAGLLVYATISGVHKDLLPAEGSDTPVDYTTVLADSSMQEVQDTDAMGNGLDSLVKSCDTGTPGQTDYSYAVPPRRFVQVAEGLEAAGAGVVVQSICQNSFAGALGVIVGKIGDALAAACLPRALNPDATGKVNCDVVETLPEGQTCAGNVSRGRYPYACQDLSDGDNDGVPDCVGVEATTTDVNGATREICRITQVVADGTCAVSGVGWYYDTCSADLLATCGMDSQRIAFSSDATKPAQGSIIRLECLQPVQGTAGEVSIATPCGADPAICDTMIEGFSQMLTCDAESNTCQAPCTEDAHCIGGFVCDVLGSGYCVNPTCGQ